MEQNLLNNMVCEIRVDVYQKRPMKNQPKITCSRDAADLLKPGWEELNYRERFKALFLNRNNRVLGVREISAGGISRTLVDVRMILQAALGVNACSMVLAHNHPSGNLTPSDADVKITRKIKEAAQVMDIAVLDHVIVTADSYYSFADEGML